MDSQARTQIGSHPEKDHENLNQKTQKEFCALATCDFRKNCLLRQGMVGFEVVGIH